MNQAALGAFLGCADVPAPQIPGTLVFFAEHTRISPAEMETSHDFTIEITGTQCDS